MMMVNVSQIFARANQEKTRQTMLYWDAIKSGVPSRSGKQKRTRACKWKKNILRDETLRQSWFCEEPVSGAHLIGP
jgi:hypothetical protein